MLVLYRRVHCPRWELAVLLGWGPITDTWTLLRYTEDEWIEDYEVVVVPYDRVQFLRSSEL
jgi:hypothetical protein